MENFALRHTEFVFYFFSALSITNAENKWNKENKSLRESK